MNKKSEPQEVSTLYWETKKVKVKDLIQFDINPRKISETMKQKLSDSLYRFNLVDIPVVNTDMKIIGGNQRVIALMLANRGEEEIDVRFPNRTLNDKELKEYAIISNTHAGEFDFEILELEFSEINLEEIGFNIPNFEKYNLVQIKDEFDVLFSLKNGDKDPFGQMTFQFANEQKIFIENAIKDIKKTQEYKYCEKMNNQNSNGNALYLIVQQWAKQKK